MTPAGFVVVLYDRLKNLIGAFGPFATREAAARYSRSRNTAQGGALNGEIIPLFTGETE